jgi:hypothetical protein
MKLKTTIRINQFTWYVLGEYLTDKRIHFDDGHIGVYKKIN